MLAKTKSVIVLEDLDVKRMLNLSFGFFCPLDRVKASGIQNHQRTNIKKYGFADDFASARAFTQVQGVKKTKTQVLSNERLSRHISDAGWREFRCMLQYKTKWYGSKLMIAPRFYPSSKTCSSCNYIVERLALEIRNWECPGCHSIHDRDVNAAKNLLRFSTGS
ncbi:MAG: zinc ribbon domain-containing protein, partial [Chlamydiales bacterium]